MYLSVLAIEQVFCYLQYIGEQRVFGLKIETMGRIFSGMQPTRELHLGNYLGALKHWVNLQKEHECVYCIVDLHGLTANPTRMRENIRYVTAAYLAAGIRAEECILFVQSDVLEHCWLGWLFSCLTPMGWLNRMTQFKEKAGKQRENAVLGLFSYPVLMAADIALYRATHVPVGEDQKQHLELCRDIVALFNRMYGTDYFPLPEPMILGDGRRVMSLRDGQKKMSKSDSSEYGRLNLTDDPDTVALKIRKAKTSSLPLPEAVAELDSEAETRNLVTIYAALTEQSSQAVLDKFGGQAFTQFKSAVIEAVIETIGPIAKNMKDLLNAPEEIDRILRQGGEKAQEMAAKHCREIKAMTGL